MGFSYIPKNNFKQVSIKWIDIIQMDSGWHTSQEIEDWINNEPDTVIQSGFIYKETETHIILIDSYFTQDYLGSAIKIPKCVIIEQMK